MLPSETQCGDWIGQSRFGRQNEEPTFRGRHLFPDNSLTRFQLHFPSQLGRDGNLPTFRDGGFHMMKLSCDWEMAKSDCSKFLDAFARELLRGIDDTNHQ